jgi:hypothetical protein
VYKLSFIEQATTRLLLPARSRENIRPQLCRFRKGVEFIKLFGLEKDGRGHKHNPKRVELAI